MKIGFIGLGKMGAGLVLNMRAHGIEVSAWNRSPHEVANVASIPEMVSALEPGHRIIWLMVPAGAPVDEMINELLPQLVAGDLIIDGGNSFYEDDLRRAKILATKEILYLDVGVSGGPSGARHGACLMIGGDQKKYQELMELWQAISAPNSSAYLGATGAGHFAKMVHNGIEYGMMQAIAEGTAVLQASPFNYDLAQVMDIYNHQSVIESRLVGWTKDALVEDPQLANMSNKIGQLGEGEWTVKTAEKLHVPTPIITESWQVRNRSTEEVDSFSNKVVNAMRGKFGGHQVTK